jgi:hypothetical protein
LPATSTESLILKRASCEVLDWQVDERSRVRTRAASALAATVQSRMARASVARVIEWAMKEE